MRVIDPSQYQVVHHGKVWEHKAEPCSKEAISLLERNESLITWLQPRGRGVEDQIPCIIVGDLYCSLSLRMMKVEVLPFCA